MKPTALVLIILALAACSNTRQAPPELAPLTVIDTGEGGGGDGGGGDNTNNTPGS